MIYKMPYPVWDKIANSIPLVQGYINEKAVIHYIERECGLKDTGEWSHPESEDEWDEWNDGEEFYHYRVINKKKFTLFLLKWDQ